TIPGISTRLKSQSNCSCRTNVEQTFADSVNKPPGNEAALSVEKCVNLVVIGELLVTLHPKKLRIVSPTCNRQIVESKRLVQSLGDGQYYYGLPGGENLVVFAVLRLPHVIEQ